MPAGLQLDHAVINVKYRMDEAQGAFTDLGFQLTERGYHSLGSINHLMMLADSYIELIGLPAPAGEEHPGRPDIADAAIGLNGLVFRTWDVAESHARLTTLDLAAGPPKSFSRPVRLARQTFEAKFSTVHVAAGTLPGGRVYFCQHHTPDLVWRPEWQSHPNGAAMILEFVVASENQVTEAETLAGILGREVAGGGGHLTVTVDNAVISFLDPASYQDRYGAMATSLAGRGSIFAALVMKCAGFAPLQRLLADAAVEVAYDDQGDRLIVRERRFDTLFEFTG